MEQRKSREANVAPASSQPVQRAAAAGGSASPSRAQLRGMNYPDGRAALSPERSPSGGGAPLPGGLRSRMENSFGAGFGDVRVHQGPQAPAIGARAYTQGSDVHFAPGEYQPGAAAGQQLLGHELAHVVQQRAGRVAAPAQAKGATVVGDAGLEAEADQAGARAARGEPAGLSGAGGGGGGPQARAVIQRETYDGTWEVKTPGLSLLGGAINWASGASGKRSQLETRFEAIRAEIARVEKALAAKGDVRGAFEASSDGIALASLRSFDETEISYDKADTWLNQAAEKLREATDIADRAPETLKSLAREKSEREKARQKSERQAAHQLRIEQNREAKRKEEEEETARKLTEESERLAFQAMDARVLKALGGSQDLKGALEGLGALSELDTALASGRISATLGNLKAVRVVAPFAGSIDTLVRLLAVASWAELQGLVPKAASSDADDMVLLLEAVGSGGVALLDQLLDTVKRGGVAALGRMVTKVGGDRSGALLTLLRATASAKGVATDAEGLINAVHGQPGYLDDLTESLRLYPWSHSVAELLGIKANAAILRAVLTENATARLTWARLKGVMVDNPDITTRSAAALVRGALDQYYRDARNNLSKDSLARVLEDGVAEVQFNEEYQTAHERQHGGYSQEYKVKFNTERWSECGWVVHIHHLAEGGNKGHVKSWAERTKREGASRLALDPSVYTFCKAASPKWG